MALFSIQIEKHVLGGLMKNQHTIADIDRFISSKDFVAEPHDIIYGCIRSSVLNNEKVDSVLIAQKIKNLGIAFKDEVNIFDYLEAISFSSITADATIKAAQELAKLSALREIEKTCDEMKGIVSKSANEDLSETISKVDSLYGEKMNSFEFENEPTLLFDDINELVEARGNNPVEELGIETPFPEFNRLYGGLRPKNLYVIAARAKAGKALEENTEIPTPEGFTKIKDLKVGDEVFALDGSITKVVAKQEWNDRRIYRVYSNDGSEVLADEDHEWVGRRRHDYKWEIIETKNLDNKLKRKRGVALPNTSSIKTTEKALPIDPYIFGLWLGDGHSKASTLTNSDEFIIKKWNDYISSIGLKPVHTGKYRHHASSNHKENIFNNKLRELNVFNNKHIPNIYLRASESQRIALLNGLIDSDGHVSNRNGYVEFCNKNKKLAYDTLELIHSLGVKASIRERKSTLYGKVMANRFRIGFFFENAALLPRKKELCRNAGPKQYQYIRSEYYGIGKTVCIQIEHDSHIFLCGRGFLPTHNSTFINALASKISQTHKIPVLILDTEMSGEETKFRAAASKTGINPWYLETGNWRKNEEMVAKVRANLANIKNNYLVYHMAIGNKSIEEIKSIARRWFFKVVKRGNKGLICFDYIKMVDKLSKNQQEYQAMGDKVDTLKKLAEELNCPILSAVQTNRSGITTGRESSEMIEDESVVGISDRICWFSSYVGLLRRKSPDEIALDTPESGNSLLKTLVSRFQGRDAEGQADVIRRRLPDGKFVFTKNYINLQFSNFDVEERGSLRDSIARQNAQFLIEDGGVQTREDDTL